MPKEIQAIVLEPVSSPRLPDVIAEQLMNRIREGTLRPGDKLPTEHDLARQLMVGRTSVREALQKLQVLGVIEVKKGRGAFVLSPGVSDSLRDFERWTREQAFAIEELVEARMMIESLAVSLAALRATDEDVATVERHCRRHAEAAVQGDFAELLASDEALHEAIMRASRNHLVAQMYAILIGELREFRRRTLALPWAAERSAAGHDAITAAIRKRDPIAARDAMIDHLWVVSTEIHETASDLPPDEDRSELELIRRSADALRTLLGGTSGRTRRG